MKTGSQIHNKLFKTLNNLIYLYMHLYVSLIAILLHNNDDLPLSSKKGMENKF